MSEKKRYNFKKILANIVWTLCGMATMVLLGAAMYKKNSDACKAVEISIKGVKNNFFIDKTDVNNMLEKINFGKLKFMPINTFDLAGMETFLEKNEWIKAAELYFDNNDVLRINIIEREPIARIFTSAGSSFYIDSSLKKLSLSEKFSARLPVFTGFPATGNTAVKADSNLLADIKNISMYISQDAFRMAQIDQVNITPDRSFEMIPKIGNQLIIFGTADNYEEKFNNLMIFYKNVLSKVGWNKYSSINVSYKNQVVAVKRGAQDIKSDSLKTIELIKLLVANAQKQASDSNNNIQLVQPKEDNSALFSKPEDESFTDEQALFNDSLFLKTPVKNPLKVVWQRNKVAPRASTPYHINNRSNPLFLNTKPALLEKSNHQRLPGSIIKKVNKKPAVGPGKQPKAVMKPPNDY